MLVRKQTIYFLALYICITLFSFSVSSRAMAYGNGFLYSRSITVDHTKVQSTDQTNFPVLVSGTYSYLATTGNGGNVQNASGYDVGFYTNSDCSTGKMNWETETYTAASGLVNYWVKVPTLTTASDYVFYMCYGNSSVTTDQSSASSVWDSNFKGVWHLPNGSTLTALDSTSNANNGTKNGTVTAVAGKVGGGANINGGSTNNIAMASGSSLGPANALTISFWVNATGSPANYHTVVSRWNGAHPYIFAINKSSSGGNAWLDLNNDAKVIAGSTNIIGGLHHVVGTYDRSNLNMYVDGSSDATAVPYTAALNTASTTVHFGTNIEGPSGRTLIGDLDEVRISDVARSADWIKTEYNNQNSPSTFYTVSAASSDTTAPVFSGVTPASSAFITNVTSSSSVAFTTDEALASGIITVTRTGGTADGSSPHVCTLVGTALNVGTHTINLSDATNGCSSDVSNLVVGTVYTFVLSGSDAMGNAATSVTSTSVTFADLPDAPTSLSATYGDAEVALSWVAPVYTGGISLTDYVIEYKLTSDLSWSIFSDGVSTTTSGTVIGLSNGSSYDFRVSAVNGAGQGSASSTATATPKTVPGAPTIGTATGGNAEASVTFSAPGSNGGSAITSYTVTSSPGSITGTGASSPITVTGLTNGTPYTFTVTATNIVGTGSASSASNSVTPATVPGAPTFVTPVEGDTQVALSWTAPADNGGASITDYVVEYKLSSSGVWLTFTDGTSSSTSATVTGLVNGSSYDFRISAVNSAGQGSASSTATATPKTVPGAPTIGTATGGNAEASVTFSAPGSNGGSAITSYTVTSSPGSITGTGASSPITVTGLTNGTPYTFTVTATNIVGTGSASSASNSVTPATVPGAPTIGTATAGNAEASVSFSAPISDGGSAITSYTVTSSPGGFTGTGASSPITVIGLTSGASYTFSVTATNSVGTGPSSGDTAPITIPVEPDAPVNLAASVQGSGMNLSWSAPADDGGLPITDYVVEYQLTVGGVWSVFADGTSTLTTASVTGLSNGTSYDFRVRAVNAVGQSIPSGSVTAIPGEPAQVLIQSFPDLTTTTIGTAVRITNEGSIAFEYQYTWCITNASDNVCGGGNDEFSSTAAKLINASENWDTTLNSTLLTPGVYYFHIEVTFGSETSSAVQSFTAVATFPDAPTIGTATGGNAEASVTFSAPGSNGGSAITSYTVTSSPGSITGTGSSSPITVTGLTNGTPYTFTVTATNIVGTGSASSASNSVTPATVPGAPTGVTATAGNGQVSLSWLAPVDNGGSAITDYVIEYKLSSDAVWLVFSDGTSTSLSATVTGLANGSGYDFRVSAVNAVGQSVINSTGGTPIGGDSGNSGGGSSGSIPRNINNQPDTENPAVVPDVPSSWSTPTTTTQKNNSSVGNSGGETVKPNEASATPSEKIINDYLDFSNPVSIGEMRDTFNPGWAISIILLLIVGLIIYFVFFRVY